MKLQIVQDETTESPREWDNLGAIWAPHQCYSLSDNDATDPRERDDVVISLPIALLDHSGLHMWIGSEPHWSDSAGWDSGQVGFIYVTREALREDFPSWKRLTKKRLARLESILRAEVEVFDQYLRGDVWGYVIEDDDGNHTDSCYGFFGDDWRENGMRENWSEEVVSIAEAQY